MASDNVSYAMAADYKSYELRQVIQDLKDLRDDPVGRKSLQNYWNDLNKSCEELKSLIKSMPPWD